MKLKCFSVWCVCVCVCVCVFVVFDSQRERGLWLDFDLFESVTSCLLQLSTTTSVIYITILEREYSTID